MKFLEQIISRTKESKKTIVLSESLDNRTIHANKIIGQKDIANIILDFQKMLLSVNSSIGKNNLL